MDDATTDWPTSLNPNIDHWNAKEKPMKVKEWTDALKQWPHFFSYRNVSTWLQKVSQDVRLEGASGVRLCLTLYSEIFQNRPILPYKYVLLESVFQSGEYIEFVDILDGTSSSGGGCVDVPRLKVLLTMSPFDTLPQRPSFSESTVLHLGRREQWNER